MGKKAESAEQQHSTHATNQCPAYIEYSTDITKTFILHLSHEIEHAISGAPGQFVSYHLKLPMYAGIFYKYTHLYRGQPFCEKKAALATLVDITFDQIIGLIPASTSIKAGVIVSQLSADAAETLSETAKIHYQLYQDLASQLPLHQRVWISDIEAAAWEYKGMSGVCHVVGIPAHLYHELKDIVKDQLFDHFHLNEAKPSFQSDNPFEFSGNKPNPLADDVEYGKFGSRQPKSLFANEHWWSSSKDSLPKGVTIATQLSSRLDDLVQFQRNHQLWDLLYQPSMLQLNQDSLLPIFSLQNDHFGDFSAWKKSTFNVAEMPNVVLTIPTCATPASILKNSLNHVYFGCAGGQCEAGISFGSTLPARDMSSLFGHDIYGPTPHNKNPIESFVYRAGGDADEIKSYRNRQETFQEHLSKINKYNAEFQDLVSRLNEQADVAEVFSEFSRFHRRFEKLMPKIHADKPMFDDEWDTILDSSIRKIFETLSGDSYEHNDFQRSVESVPKEARTPLFWHVLFSIAQSDHLKSRYYDEQSRMDICSEHNVIITRYLIPIFRAKSHENKAIYVFNAIEHHYNKLHPDIKTLLFISAVSTAGDIHDLIQLAELSQRYSPNLISDGLFDDKLTLQLQDQNNINTLSAHEKSVLIAVLLQTNDVELHTKAYFISVLDGDLDVAAQALNKIHEAKEKAKRDLTNNGSNANTRNSKRSSSTSVTDDSIAKATLKLLTDRFNEVDKLSKVFDELHNNLKFLEDNKVFIDKYNKLNEAIENDHGVDFAKGVILLLKESCSLYIGTAWHKKQSILSHERMSTLGQVLDGVGYIIDIAKAATTININNAANIALAEYTPELEKLPKIIDYFKSFDLQTSLQDNSNADSSATHSAESPATLPPQSNVHDSPVYQSINSALKPLHTLQVGLTAISSFYKLLNLMNARISIPKLNINIPIKIPNFIINGIDGLSLSINIGSSVYDTTSITYHIYNAGQLVDVGNLKTLMDSCTGGMISILNLAIFIDNKLKEHEAQKILNSDDISETQKMLTKKSDTMIRQYLSGWVDEFNHDSATNTLLKFEMLNRIFKLLFGKSILYFFNPTVNFVYSSLGFSIAARAIVYLFFVSYWRKQFNEFAKSFLEKMDEVSDNPYSSLNEYKKLYDEFHQNLDPNNKKAHYISWVTENDYKSDQFYNIGAFLQLHKMNLKPHAHPINSINNDMQELINIFSEAHNRVMRFVKTSNDGRSGCWPQNPSEEILTIYTNLLGRMLSVYDTANNIYINHVDDRDLVLHIENDKSKTSGDIGIVHNNLLSQLSNAQTELMKQIDETTILEKFANVFARVIITAEGPNEGDKKLQTRTAQQLFTSARMQARLCAVDSFLRLVMLEPGYLLPFNIKQILNIVQDTLFLMLRMGQHFSPSHILKTYNLDGLASTLRSFTLLYVSQLPKNTKDSAEKYKKATWFLAGVNTMDLTVMLYRWGSDGNHLYTLGISAPLLSSVNLLSQIIPAFFPTEMHDDQIDINANYSYLHVLAASIQQNPLLYLLSLRLQVDIARRSWTSVSLSNAHLRGHASNKLSNTIYQVIGALITGAYSLLHLERFLFYSNSRWMGISIGGLIVSQIAVNTYIQINKPQSSQQKHNVTDHKIPTEDDDSQEQFTFSSEDCCLYEMNFFDEQHGQCRQNVIMDHQEARQFGSQSDYPPMTSSANRLKPLFSPSVLADSIQLFTGPNAHNKQTKNTHAKVDNIIDLRPFFENLPANIMLYSVVIHMFCKLYRSIFTCHKSSNSNVNQFHPRTSRMTEHYFQNKRSTLFYHSGTNTTSTHYIEDLNALNSTAKIL